MPRQIIFLLIILFSAERITEASAPQDPRHEACVKFIWAESEDGRSNARNELNKILSLDEYIRYLRNYKNDQSLSLQTASDAEALAMGLCLPLEDLVFYAETCLLSQVISKIPPSLEDYKFLVKLFEFNGKIFEAVSIISDIREPGAPCTFKNAQTNKFVQGCAVRITGISALLVVLGSQREDVKLMKQGREWWQKAWDSMSPEAQKLACNLPFKEGASEDEKKTALGEFVSVLRVRYRDPRIPLTPKPISPRDMTPGDVAKRDKLLQELRQIVTRLYEAAGKGDVEAARVLFSPKYDSARVYLAKVEKRSIRSASDDRTEFGLEKWSSDSASIVISQLLIIEQKSDGGQEEQVRGMQRFEFERAEKDWLITKIGW